jgi:hypothetical protein
MTRLTLIPDDSRSCRAFLRCVNGRRPNRGFSPLIVTLPPPQHSRSRHTHFAMATAQDVQSAVGWYDRRQWIDTQLRAVWENKAYVPAAPPDS